MDPLKPWREVAAKSGFVPVGGGSMLCGSTFLDLHGSPLEHIALKTWLDADNARVSLTTFAVVPPRTLRGKLVRAVLYKLAKSENRPLELREPQDLETAIRRHFAELLSIAARPVKIVGDPLDWRAQQEARDDRI